MTLVEMPQEAELLDDDVDLSALSLDELAARANSEHALVESCVDAAIDAWTNGVFHAIYAGEALLAAKRLHEGKGDWRVWVEDNFDANYRTAARYMRIAFYRDRLSPGQVSVKSAQKSLEGLPPLPGFTTHLQSASEKSTEAVRLREAGFTQAEVAEALDVSSTTVWRLTVPGADAKNREAARRRRAKNAKARKALAEKEKADAIRKAGGNISTAYGYVRKAAAELDAALGNATSPEVRTALRAALAGVHKAEDEIGKAARA